MPRAAEPPKLDGILDDQVWTQAPMPTGQWVSYNPNRGDNMPDVYKTDVRIAYDDRNIYFAFHCFDNEPEKIRTNVAKRDAAFSDDWIALSLDSAGTGQAAYHLFSNPSASQMDALNTSASGEQFDADMVWFSAAKTTADGYVVEVQIPLQTLRFSGGDEVKMNLVFFRKVSRIGYSYAWPEMLPGQWVFDRPSRLIFSNLKPRRLVELLPSVTYGVNQQRETANTWSAGRRQVQLRRERQARDHVRHHARRHDQSRLQPGRERRVPGPGQPALSRCSSRRSVRSSWKAWACSTLPAPVATATCARPCTRAASSIRFTDRSSPGRSARRRSAC